MLKPFLTANWRYLAMLNFAVDPMRSEVEDRDGIVRVKYEWRRGNKWEHLAMTAHGEAQSCALGSHEEFITEHYWGYTARSERTSEYRVEHPRWKIWPADSFELKADIATLYGEKFLEPLTAKPISAFIADGSYVEVQRRATEPASQGPR